MKKLIMVEIPDGAFCSGGLLNPQINCDYVGDSTASSAGLCSLLAHSNSLLRYEDKINWRIVKHKHCPSLRKSREAKPIISKCEGMEE